jgi:hypothetical protein
MSLVGLDAEKQSDDDFISRKRLPTYRMAAGLAAICSGELHLLASIFVQLLCRKWGTRMKSAAA